MHGATGLAVADHVEVVLGLDLELVYQPQSMDMERTLTAVVTARNLDIVINNAVLVSFSNHYLLY